MGCEKVREYLRPMNLEDRVREFEESSATVEEAARDLGCEPKLIAKSMAFKTGSEAIVVVIAGDGKVDNSKYKALFHTKAVMVHPEELMELVGHPMGGVCPFAVNEGVKTYLDISLKRFETVYPAAGTPNSAVKLKVEELEKAAQNFAGWVDIAKGWE